mmetsp:Transcript_73404/g.160770  ORF Transcript_73404/g.160770 Transcript_73404/m.160770 type:complete len:219 (+) Transcript_73404:1281-1937(+)
MFGGLFVAHVRGLLSDDPDAASTGGVGNCRSGRRFDASRASAVVGNAGKATLPPNRAALRAVGDGVNGAAVPCSVLLQLEVLLDHGLVRSLGGRGDALHRSVELSQLLVDSVHVPTHGLGAPRVDPGDDPASGEYERVGQVVNTLWGRRIPLKLPRHCRCSRRVRGASEVSHVGRHRRGEGVLHLVGVERPHFLSGTRGLRGGGRCIHTHTKQNESKQ